MRLEEQFEEEKINLKWVITELKKAEEFLKVKAVIARTENKKELRELLAKIRDVRRYFETEEEKREAEEEERWKKKAKEE